MTKLLDVRKKLTQLTTPPVLAKFFGDTNAGTRSVCGSYPTCYRFWFNLF